MPGQVVKELGEKLPGAGLYNCYGQSEIAPLATVLLPEEHADRPSSAGRPMQTVMARIVDPVTGKDCKPGEQLPKNTAGKLLKRKLRDDLG